jgi:hypothetical protein
VVLGASYLQGVAESMTTCSVLQAANDAIVAVLQYAKAVSEQRAPGGVKNHHLDHNITLFISTLRRPVRAHDAPMHAYPNTPMAGMQHCAQQEQCWQTTC